MLGAVRFFLVVGASANIVRIITVLTPPYNPMASRKLSHIQLPLLLPSTLPKDVLRMHLYYFKYLYDCIAKSRL